MLRVLLFVGSLFILACATKVKRCEWYTPFPLQVRFEGCKVPPCDIIMGKSVQFEVDFKVEKFTTKATTLVKAKAMGITVPYELPDNVSDVCHNLKFTGICPLYPAEETTYYYSYPIANSYPETNVTVQIKIVDQDDKTVTCFKIDIKVKNDASTNSKNHL